LTLSMSTMQGIIVINDGKQLEGIWLHIQKRHRCEK
jgi:hypothetical protein